MPGVRGVGEKEGSVAQQRRQARRCLQQLLKLHVLRGSIETGILVHDLVRDCMIRRAEASGVTAVVLSNSVAGEALEK